MFLSDRDVTDFAAGVSCTNLRVAESEVRKLRDLYVAINWLKGRLAA